MHLDLRHSAVSATYNELYNHRSDHRDGKGTKTAKKDQRCAVSSYFPP